MHTFFQDSEGFAGEAVVLSATPACMRVVIKGQEDVTEWRLAEGCWISEQGTEIELEALIADDATDMDRFCFEERARTLTADGC